METLQLIQRKLVYNEWANRRALESLQAMDTLSSRGVRALSHVLLVEKLWLARLRREEMKVPLEFFPGLPLPECGALIDENRNGYRGYLEAVKEQGLDAIQDFQTIKGDKYQLSIRDVLTHVMMHSMYHRGQVALAIREDGGEPLQSDYSLFMRETTPSFVIGGI